ncbi:DUF5994 family protein [Actinosynnema sp. NPDC047251]|uniref:Uncharacterized protein n=1 Tax=Saccharothrix espanaensis (strain ATCC 51144 / DSM 44229 / JCM 9112 / NBRC 15066 / NRRL 15764) TaxID=1179773 RepID=K0JYS1_SACES|nr:DUF5994 family protein [Saccharothrix espanaensis]CCH33080.1 hypothetical protein BN6_58220 [Saccharothrix espanaensis DSM 44229]
MTSAPHLPLAPPVTEPPRHPRRLRLRPVAHAAGHVDGAWWPRSRDLAAELPALPAALTARLGEIVRVNYGLAEWNSAHRRVAASGRQLRLDGFTSQPAHTVDLIAADKRRITLLVVPPNTEPAAAHRIMTLAVDRDNVQTVGELLAAGGEATAPPRHPTDPTRVVFDGREAGGGRIPQQKNRCTS